MGAIRCGGSCATGANPVSPGRSSARAAAVVLWSLIRRIGTSTEASDPAGMSHLRNVRARQPRRRCVRSEAGRPAAHVRVVLSLAQVRGPGYTISRTNDVPTAERAGSDARGVACAAQAANGSPFTRLSAAPRRTANRPKGPCKPQGLQGPRYGKCCLERHEDVSGQDSKSPLSAPGRSRSMARPLECARRAPVVVATAHRAHGYSVDRAYNVPHLNLGRHGPGDRPIQTAAEAARTCRRNRIEPPPRGCPSC